MIYLLSDAVLAYELGVLALPGLVLVDLRAPGAVEAMLMMLEDEKALPDLGRAWHGGYDN